MVIRPVPSSSNSLNAFSTCGGGGELVGHEPRGQIDGVDAQLPPAEAELAKALDSVGFERVMIEFESPGPLGTPFAHNKLVALERRPGPTASLIKYLELTADGRPVMDGLARYILGELAAF